MIPRVNNKFQLASVVVCVSDLCRQRARAADPHGREVSQDTTALGALRVPRKRQREDGNRR